MSKFDFSKGNLTAVENRRIYEFFCRRDCFISTAMFNHADRELSPRLLTEAVDQVFPNNQVSTTLTMSNELVVVLRSGDHITYTAFIGSAGNTHIYGPTDVINTALPGQFSIRTGLGVISTRVEWFTPIYAELVAYLDECAAEDRCADHLNHTPSIKLADFHASLMAAMNAPDYDGNPSTVAKGVWANHIDAAVYSADDGIDLRVRSWAGEFMFCDYDTQLLWFNQIGGPMEVAIAVAFKGQVRLNCRTWKLSQLVVLTQWLVDNDPTAEKTSAS